MDGHRPEPAKQDDRHAGAAAPGIPSTVYEVLALLVNGDYVADRALATSLFLSLTLRRPLFLEGEAGVGKTEVAKVLALMLDRRLIRLQCYEGLDVASAVYEWDYPRQMIEIRLAEATHEVDREQLQKDIFSEEFLIRRPLLEALQPHPGGPPVLLIDELDRTDEPFEAFLLEILADFQVSVPEIGTIAAEEPPIVVITSNRTREIHDALKRRCFYHWIDYPTASREHEIIRVKVPDAPRNLRDQIVGFVQRLRREDLFKVPGVAESLDWARALLMLDKTELDPAVVEDTLGVLLKYEDDLARIKGSVAKKTLEAVKSQGEGKRASRSEARTSGPAERRGERARQKSERERRKADGRDDKPDTRKKATRGPRAKEAETMSRRRSGPRERAW